MESRLSWISSHHALFLLKNCFALPKLLYVLRTSPCFDHPLLQSFDDLQFELLRKLLNINLVDHARQQASLPVSLGGLGVISATAIASSAFISSKHSCANLEASLLSASLSLPPQPPPDPCPPLQVLSMPSPTGKIIATLMIPLHPLNNESGLRLYLEISSSHF